MKINDLSLRVDQLIEMGQRVLSTKFVEGYTEWINSGEMTGFRSASLSFIERVYGSEQTHYKEFERNTNGSHPSHAESGMAILCAIKAEIDGGWLFTIKSLVASELFLDFIEMAEHLLASGYKDPSAVMIGGVLEEHLRQLCKYNNIEIEEQKNGKSYPLKADRLNSDLAKANVYAKLDQKMVTAWLDLRNKAAHGKYSEYNEDQVRQLIQSVTEFIARVSIQ